MGCREMNHEVLAAIAARFRVSAKKVRPLSPSVADLVCPLEE
jgi:hypothetical protein